MTDETVLKHRPRPRSPAAHLAEVCAATGTPETVHLREVPFAAQVELRLAEEESARRRAADAVGLALPEVGRISGDGRPWLAGCGPGWYLLLHPDGEGAERAARLAEALGTEEQEVCASVVDVSAQRTMLELRGPRARDVLAHGCALDLHPRRFRPGHYAQTLVAKAGVGLLQSGGEPAYRILVRASYADYLTRWLLDAMVEYTAPAGTGAHRAQGPGSGC